MYTAASTIVMPKHRIAAAIVIYVFFKRIATHFCVQVYGKASRWRFWHLHANVVV